MEAYDRLLNQNNPHRAILILENSRGTTGAFKSIWEMTQALKNRFSFHYAIDKKSSLIHFLRKEGATCLEIPFLEIRKDITLFFYLPTLLMNTLRILRYCKSHQIDIIHVNDLYNMIGILVKLFRPRIHVVYHVRLLPNSYARSLYGLWRVAILRYADATIAVSKTVQRALGDNLKSRVSLIYDFIPLKSPQPAADPSVLPGVRFLYPANYVRGKGQEFALHAFRELANQRKDCTLQFTGGDFGLEKNRLYREALQASVYSMNLSDRVLVAGPIDPIEDAMKRADIILNFSESESFSLVSYEAMMMGCPLIASDCGGPSELIDNGVTGLLVANRDVHAMTKAMLKLAEDKMLRDRLGSNARITIMKRAADHDAVARLANVYNGLDGERLLT